RSFEWRDPANVQSRHHGGNAVLVHRDFAAALRRPSRHRGFWRIAQASSGPRRPDGHRVVQLARPSRPEWICGRVSHLPRRVFPGMACFDGFDSRVAGDRGGNFFSHSESLYGAPPQHFTGFADLHTGERLALAPVIGLMLLIGILPQLIVNSVNPTVQYLLAHWRF